MGKSNAAGFIDFLNRTPTPYHAVKNSANLLIHNGFKRLNLAESWNLERGGRYFITKNMSTIIAFVLGGEFKAENGYVIIGAHTDSPCLKVRPISKLCRSGFKQISVSTYGGGLWRTWMDRGLGLAGVCIFRHQNEIKQRLVDFNGKPILCIPNLAIHLQRDEVKLDLEEQIQPIFMLDKTEKNDTPCCIEDHHPELLASLANECQCSPEDIVDFDLRTYPTEPAELSGLKQEFILGARLDNLVGVYTSIMGLIESCTDATSLKNDPYAKIVCCFDHEEVGSESATGAQSDIVNQLLKRLTVSGDNITYDTFSRAIANSYIVSADQAHGCHPNFSDKHDRSHRPQFDGSVVVKVNANQRYTTTSHSYTILSEIARKANVKLTRFVVKNTSSCGSTIGPMISANTAALTIDVGCSQLAMHSAREFGDAASIDSAIKLYNVLFNSYNEVLDSLAHRLEKI